MRLKTLKAAAAAAVAALSLGAFAPSASAGTDLYLGEIFQVGFNYCPPGSLAANGQSLPVNQNSALFSLLGTTFGGDGVTTFKLPDLQGRSIVHQGQGPGLSYVMIGESGGAETVKLTTSNLPTHTHPVAGYTLNNPLKIKGETVQVEPYANANSIPAVAVTRLESQYVATETDFDYSNKLWAPATNTLPAGDNTPVPIRSPYLVMNTCIATSGYFPTRP